MDRKQLLSEVFGYKPPQPAQPTQKVAPEPPKPAPEAPQAEARDIVPPPIMAKVQGAVWAKPGPGAPKGNPQGQGPAMKPNTSGWGQV